MNFKRIGIPVLTLALLGTSGLVMGQRYALQGPPPPPPPGYGPPPQGPGGWEGPPDDYRDREVARRGFHDGIEGARKDVDNHRRPNVNNRDEYRHPDVGGRDRREYRDAFRRGYNVGIQHLLGAPRPY